MLLRATTKGDLFRPPDPGEAGERVVYLQGQRDRFVIVAPLGEGGMSEVFLGSRLVPETGVMVRTIHTDWYAIKLPREDIDRESRALFLKEAAAVAKVDHPNVVKVIDWGDEPLFIVFERVVGGDLAKEVARRRGESQPWLESELVAMYRQLVSAMKAVNAQVVHRDVKSSNIFLEGNNLRIGDFGLAKAVDESTRSLTHKGAFTPQFAAPEVWATERYTWAADQYSMGIVFFELATFERPFKGPTNEDLRQAHLYQAPALATHFRPDLSTGLATLIARMMRKAARDRFVSWEDIEAALAGREGAPHAEGPRLNLSAIKRAAAHIETATARDLKAREEAEARTRTERDRVDLQKFWQERIHAHVETLAVQLRAELSLKLPVKRQGKAILFSFLESELLINFTPTPADQDEILLWGDLRLGTPKKVHFSHVLLFLDAADPYGQWREAELREHALYRTARENVDGLLRFPDGIYQARGWPAFADRRRAQSMTSFTQYSERALDWDKRLPALFETLINEAQ